MHSLEETVEGLQSSLQQHKEQLQQKEVTNSVLQEQCVQVRCGCGSWEGLVGHVSVA